MAEENATTEGGAGGEAPAQATASEAGNASPAGAPSVDGDDLGPGSASPSPATEQPPTEELEEHAMEGLEAPAAVEVSYS